MTNHQILLSKALCPECRAGKLGSKPAERHWYCLRCGAQFPLIDGVPALFRLRDQAVFLQYSARRQIKSKEARASSSSWAIYHWNTYGFENLLPLATSVGQELLVFGCGSGDDRSLIEDKGFSVTNFDIYRTDGTDLMCDGHNLPFENATFDMVLSSQVFEHLQRPWEAMKEIERILRPGGVLVGSVAFIKPYHGSYFHMTFAGIRSLLEYVDMELDHAHAAQSVLWSIFVNMLPFSTPRSLRPAVRSCCMVLEDVYWYVRCQAWALLRRQKPHQTGIRVLDGLPVSYEQFHRLKYAPAVVFRARKPVR